jgi:hypothetical protein
MHVAKFDHFWWLAGKPDWRERIPVGSCYLLVVHAGMLIYGTVIVAYLFQHEIEKNKLWEKKYFNLANLEELGASPYIIFPIPLPEAHIALRSSATLWCHEYRQLVLFLGYHVWRSLVEE